MKKLHIPPDRDWRILLKKHEISTIKIARARSALKKNMYLLRAYCPINSACYICRSLFPETKSYYCPCAIFYKKDVVAFAKKALREYEEEIKREEEIK